MDLRTGSGSDDGGTNPAVLWTRDENVAAIDAMSRCLDMLLSDDGQFFIVDVVVAVGLIPVRTAYNTIHRKGMGEVTVDLAFGLCLD